MKTFFTPSASRLPAYLIFIFLLATTLTASSQCQTLANTHFPVITESFNAPVFTASAGVSYHNGSYQAEGNVSSFSITSYKFQVVGNIIAVGAQITNGDDRVGACSIEIIENGNVSCFYKGALQDNNISARISGLNGKVVQFRFTFARVKNGNITFDNFGIDPALAVLPVQFTHLSAAYAMEGTQLTWKIADAQNVKGYAVESSTNGVQFHSIGFTPAADKNIYTYTDAQPAQGTVYYRIKNIDNDGRYSYSTVIVVNKGTAATVVKAFPTPAKNNITVQHDAVQNATITLSAQDGTIAKVVKPAKGAMQTAIDLSGLPAGLYLLKWEHAAGQPSYLKIIKQ